MSDFNVNPANPNIGGPVGAYPEGPAVDTSLCNEGVIPEDELLLLAGTAQMHTVDGQTTVKRPIADIIALDKHLANRRARCQTGGNAWGSIGKSKVVPPSATGDV